MDYLGAQVSESTGRKRSGAVGPWVIVGLFVFVCGLGMIHHEMWRDELRVWLLLRDNPDLATLLHNLRYEGHPALWYLILYPMARVTTRPEAMQAVHLLLATGSVAVLVRFAPFSLPRKAMIALGYFPLYEYGVFSRLYSLGLLALFGLCALYPYRHRHPLLLSGLIVLLANANAYGFILSIAFAATLILPDGRSWLRSDRSASRPVMLTIAAGLMLVGWWLSAWQMIPPADGYYQVQLSGPLSLGARVMDGIGKSCILLWEGYIPLPSIWGANPPLHFWNTNLLTQSYEPLRYFLTLYAGLLLFIAGAVSLSGNGRALAFCIVGSGGVLLLSVLKLQSTTLNYPALRHHGHLFIVWLVCVWLTEQARRSPVTTSPARGTVWVNRWRMGFFDGLLVVHLAAAGIAYGIDWREPFSQSQAAGRWLSSRSDLSLLPLVGGFDFAVEPLSAWSGRTIFYPQSDRFGTYVVSDRRRQQGSSATALIAAASRLARERGGEALIVQNEPLGAVSTPAVRITELARFDGSIVPDESFYFYRLSLHPDSSAGLAPPVRR